MIGYIPGTVFLRLASVARELRACLLWRGSSGLAFCSKEALYLPSVALDWVLHSSSVARDLCANLPSQGSFGCCFSFSGAAMKILPGSGIHSCDGLVNLISLSRLIIVTFQSMCTDRLCQLFRRWNSWCGHFARMLLIVLRYAASWLWKFPDCMGIMICQLSNIRVGRIHNLLDFFCQFSRLAYSNETCKIRYRVFESTSSKFVRRGCDQHVAVQTTTPTRLIKVCHTWRH